MNTYEPNFNDPRILARSLKVLNFVELYLRNNQTTWIASKEFYRHFGNTSRPLGQYLKNLVLDTSDPYFNSATGICKKYLLNPAGVQQLKRLARQENFVPTVGDNLVSQIVSGKFEYEVKSDRMWNPIQQLTRQARGSVLANHGYRFNYDIEAAAPTLLLQRAQQRDPDLSLPALEHYIQHRSQVRDQIAQECGVTPDQAKLVLNAVLQGAVLSVWRQSKLFQSLDCNYTAVRAIQQCKTFCEIRDDIRTMWASLKSDFPVKYTTFSTGRQKRARLTGRDKSSYYRALELQVGKIIQRELRKQNIKFLWLHDGWSCNQLCDPNQVTAQVRRKTGFVIRIDYDLYAELE